MGTISRREFAALALVGTLSACRATAGYNTPSLSSTNQFPPPPPSVAGSGGSTQMTPPPQGLPGERPATPEPDAVIVLPNSGTH